MTLFYKTVLFTWEDAIERSVCKNEGEQDELVTSLDEKVKVMNIN